MLGVMFSQKNRAAALQLLFIEKYLLDKSHGSATTNVQNAPSRQFFISMVNDKCKSDKMFFLVKFNNKNASEPCFFFLYGAQSIVNRKMSDFILSVNIVKNYQCRSVYTRVIE